jgi:hypothetical protein
MLHIVEGYILRIPPAVHVRLAEAVNVVRSIAIDAYMAFGQKLRNDLTRPQRHRRTPLIATVCARGAGSLSTECATGEFGRIVVSPALRPAEYPAWSAGVISR